MRALAVGLVLVAALSGVVALASPSKHHASSDVCGVERWKVKTLTEKDAQPAVEMAPGDMATAQPAARHI
jgi:hypothetical protein